MLRVEWLIALTKSLHARLLLPRELHLVKEDPMQIAVNQLAPRFVTAKMSSKARSDFLWDTNEEMGRGIGRGKVREGII